MFALTLKKAVYTLFIWMEAMFPVLSWKYSTCFDKGQGSILNQSNYPFTVQSMLNTRCSYYGSVENVIICDASMWLGV